VLAGRRHESRQRVLRRDAGHSNARPAGGGRAPARTLIASVTSRPATIALVVAIAWMMLPAMPLAANALWAGMP
jgi:hypothetical protein